MGSGDDLDWAREELEDILSGRLEFEDSSLMEALGDIFADDRHAAYELLQEIADPSELHDLYTALIYA